MVGVYELLFGWIDIISLARRHGDEPLRRDSDIASLKELGWGIEEV